MTMETFTRITCDATGCYNFLELPARESRDETGIREAIHNLWGWEFVPTILDDLGPAEPIFCAHHAALRRNGKLG